ncbi:MULTISPECIES: DUF1722 domain-containing protein [Tatumella]|uniref:YbgA family protein n=1 Tax=Tatumella punctata TaxID=399969 RepID=A0ABW1VP60_9GAMM|nr:DUF1722 domain-containing protein [Tatumella sp. JGM16]MBS0875876.1 DUF1722 domain-containing protein [Tatumella sp. JGM82]MBS0890281.1 DUF1722 domain-containing protein [Tatumella sp. JGM94]MBS0894217.1 DUF1722 domain-containing protein [Tatumella sp. JGM130]MBS0900407.1 DUF1722 domain-containing protein [Tatumella sp. JGM100]MBS0911311.1 DUF1722 domain-containing protein [Tatumella sp. JGM91]
MPPLVVAGLLAGSDYAPVTEHLLMALPAEWQLLQLPLTELSGMLQDCDVARSNTQPKAYYPELPVSGIIVSRNVTESGDALFSPQHLQRQLVDMPVCSEDGLQDPEQRRLFIQAVSARAEFDALCESRLSAHQLIQFHSRYKSLLLAHSQPLYRQLGPLVAGISEWSSLKDFAAEYRSRMMAIMLLPDSRANHTNVLMHIQGYFRPYLSSARRQHLTETIEHYRCGLLPLSVPVTELRQLLAEYPHPWLESQRYLFPYLPSARKCTELQEDK